MSTEEDSELGSVKLQVGEGRDGLWGKTKKVKSISFVGHNLSLNHLKFYTLIEGL